MKINYLKIIVLTASILLFNTAQKTFAQISKGTGNFMYNGYKPLADKPIKVWYYSPIDAPANLPIVFVMHGVKRNGDDYRDNWIDLAKKHNLLIIVPAFSKEYYPKSRSYNLGNMFDTEGNPIKEEKWSYSVIEPLFSHIKNMIESKQESYILFGHSAGAQFVHRFVLFKPQNQARLVISANAGWYTMPDFGTAFPYGLKNTATTSKGLGKSFDKKMIILLGEDDKDPNHKHLRKTAEAMVQGAHRFERGQYFYKESLHKAEEMNVRFNWEIATVPNVGHQNLKMAEAAVSYMAEE